MKRHAPSSRDPVPLAVGVSVRIVLAAGLLLAAGPSRAAAQSTGSISGTVTDAVTGAPLAGVQVFASKTTGGYLGPGISGASGAYTISGLLPGTYYVLTSNYLGYVDEIYDNLPRRGDDFSAATFVGVTAGAAIGGIDFSLAVGGTITGTVTDAGTAAPLPGVYVYVYSGGGVWIHSVITDASGVYTASGFLSGTYYLRTENNLGYIDELYNNLPCPGGGCVVTTGAGVNVTVGATTSGIHFGLAGGGTISGTVSDAGTGAPLAGVQVLFYAATGDYAGFVVTDALGAYVKSGLAGTYFLRTVNSLGYVDELYNNIPFTGTSCAIPVTIGTNVSVTAGATTSGIDFGLAVGGTITGTVTDARTGTPLTGVQVNVFDASGAPVAYGSTNTSGFYTTLAQPTGTYYLRTWNNLGYVDELYNNVPCAGGSCTVTTGTGVSVTAGATTSGIDFALSSGGTISGTVTDAGTGAPLAGVDVYVYNASGSYVDFASTNALGSYTRPDLPAGTYYLRTANGLGYIDELYNDQPCESGTCTVTTGTDVTVTVGATTSGINFALTAGVKPEAAAWLAYVNRYRANAGLPFLTENPSWSDGDFKHARYTVRNDILGHDEDPAKLDYTPEGRLAAQNGNVMSTWDMATSDEGAIDTFMRDPFHAIGIIDPHLAQTGFGSFRESGPAYQMAAALDVLRGRGSLSPGVTYPVFWPADGRSVAQTSYTGGEIPDPLTACAGYVAPTGLPIIVQLGPGWTAAPPVTASSFLENGVPLAHCLFDETSYTNPDPGMQSLGRDGLNTRDAIVLIPRNPLVPGKRYTASITAGGTTYTWTFRVGTLTPGGVPGDFDGDAMPDVAVYRPSAGTWFSLDSSSGNTTFSAHGWGVLAEGDVPVRGDFDGDGQVDPTVYRPATGTWFILRSSADYGDWEWFGWGNATDTLVPADYDGDGKTDGAVYRSSTGQWFIRPSSGAAAWSAVFGQADDVAVPADYDGDGTTDIAVYRPPSGTWFILTSSSGFVDWTYQGWGVQAEGDVPAPGDYDGDGKTDLTVYRPSSGTWFVLKSSAHNTEWMWDGWGDAADTPVPGDYDGDGRTDLAIYRATTGEWWVKPSSGTTPWQVVFGAADDVPLQAMQTLQRSPGS